MINKKTKKIKRIINENDNRNSNRNHNSNNNNNADDGHELKHNPNIINDNDKGAF